MLIRSDYPADFSDRDRVLLDTSDVRACLRGDRFPKIDGTNLSFHDMPDDVDPEDGVECNLLAFYKTPYKAVANSIGLLIAAYNLGNGVIDGGDDAVAGLLIEWATDVFERHWGIDSVSPV